MQRGHNCQLLLRIGAGNAALSSVAAVPVLQLTTDHLTYVVRRRCKVAPLEYPLLRESVVFFINACCLFILERFPINIFAGRVPQNDIRLS